MFKTYEKQNDNVFYVLGENNSGYTKCIENAGFYEQEEICFKKQVKSGDILIHKSIIEKLMKKVRLPIYGDNSETYGDRNEFLYYQT